MKPILLLAVLLVFPRCSGGCAQNEANAASANLRNPADAAIWTRFLEQASTAAGASGEPTAGCFLHSNSSVKLSLACTNLGTRLSPLPPLDPGVAEIKFGDFFRKPIGPRGLELTEKLRDLDGHRVRLLGYMVREDHGSAGRLLLTPFPVQIHSHDCALADDLPPSTVSVIVPQAGSTALPFTPKLLLLTGTLNLGSRAEPDGRTSLVRLTLDQMKDPPVVPQSITNSKTAASNTKRPAL